MNPIVRRELLEFLRTRRAVTLQLGLALTCALLVLARWPTEGSVDLGGVRSQQVLRVFAYGILAAILLLVPAYPATTLVREKMKGTLALLLNSPMTSWSIYLGKVGGVLGFILILLVMTTPAAAACHALGGGTTARGGIVRLYGVLFLAAVQLSTLALLVSCLSRSTDSALRTTYALVLVESVFTLAPFELLRGQADITTQLASWLRCLSPIPAVMELLGQGDVGSHGLLTRESVVGRYILLASITSLGCAATTIRSLNHKLFDRARSAGIMTEDRSTVARMTRRFLFLVDPQRRSVSMTLLVNPVMTKEFRSRRFGRSHWTLRLIAICAILSLGLSYIAASGILGWGVDIIGGALVLLQISLLILFSPSLAAGLVSAERESGSWQLLRMTPLSPGKILRGKLLSVVWPLLLLLCATLPGYMAMIVSRPSLIHQVQRIVICLVVTGIFSLLVSAVNSTLFRSTAAASTASYLSLLAFCVAPLLVWLGRDAPFGHTTVRAALLISPVATALEAADTPEFVQYELLPANWWIIGSVCAALLVFLRVRIWQLYRPE